MTRRPTLTRRGLLVSLAPAAGALVACGISGGRRSSTPTSMSPAAGGYAEITATIPGGPIRGTILVMMPETSQTRDVWIGLSDELRGQYRLVAVRAEGPGAVAAIAEGMRRHQPAAVVLMNNPTVAAYRAYQRQVGGTRFPPAVIVMTSFLYGHPTQVIAATGISYEIPLITAVTNLRRLVAAPIERVGVIRRASLAGFARRQAELAGREQIAVIEEEVGNEPNPSEIKRALRRVKERAEALWILNDDRLLTPALIAEGWLPALAERPFRPSIVGAASLMPPRRAGAAWRVQGRSFGTFAVLPDHAALGAQAANLVFDLAERGWVIPEGAEVELPVSTTTTVDLAEVRGRFALRDGALQHVDHVLE